MTKGGRVIYVAKDDAEIAAYSATLSATLNLTDDEAEIAAYGDGQAWIAQDESDIGAW